MVNEQKLTTLLHIDGELRNEIRHLKDLSIKSISLYTIFVAATTAFVSNSPPSLMLVINLSFVSFFLSFIGAYQFRHAQRSCFESKSIQIKILNELNVIDDFYPSRWSKMKNLTPERLQEMDLEDMGIKEKSSWNPFTNLKRILIERGWTPIVFFLLGIVSIFSYLGSWAVKTFFC